MDLFKGYFTRETLAGVINKTPFIPGQLGASGLFQTLGLTSTTALLEELPLESIAESAAIARGSPASAIVLGNRNVHPFQTATYAWKASVLADEVLNVRAAGSGAAEVISQRIAEKTNKLRQLAAFQHEYLRVTCLNAPSNSIGNAPAAAVVAFGASDTAIRTAIHNNIVLPLEATLRGMPYAGIDAYCSDTYWVALIESKTVRETYLNTQAAADLRNAPADSFSYGGVTWHRYRAGGNIAITAGTAKIVPRGIPGLFVQAFAPNDTLSSVGAGALGGEVYLDGMAMDGDKGYCMTLQTHPVMVCARPEAILTVDLS
jgi:hypothetical protein